MPPIHLFREPRPAQTAVGRGTSAIIYKLDVYRIGGTPFTKVYERTIAEYYGPGEMWWYDVNFGEEHSNLLSINLSLIYSPPTHDPLEDLSLIPKAHDLKIYWNVEKKQMMESPN